MLPREGCLSPGRPARGGRQGPMEAWWRARGTKLKKMTKCFPREGFWRCVAQGGVLKSGLARLERPLEVRWRARGI